jgi:hypothetical protein
MTRSQLARLIDFGRRSSLDCLKMHKDIRHEWSEIAPERDSGALFALPLLNDCIFLKTVEADLVRGRMNYAVKTLLYFPYNYDNIYEGGDSVAADDPNLQAKLFKKIGRSLSDPTSREQYRGDRPILELIEAIPTFDPFIFKSKALQLDLEGRIHPGFFNVDEAEWKILQRRIRGKIRALVERAVQGQGNESFGTVERHVTRFLNKIWEARDVEGIEDLVASLGIAIDKAPDLFFAWKAICYYQSKYRSIEPSLKSFFAWIGGKETSVPQDFATLPPEMRDTIAYSVRVLRGRLRQNHAEVTEILSDYETGYDAFIADGNPARFKAFLADADRHCLRLAAGLAAHAHSINLVYDLTSRWGNVLPSRPYFEVLDGLKTVYGTGEARGADFAAGGGSSMIKPVLA